METLSPIPRYTELLRSFADIFEKDIVVSLKYKTGIYNW